MHRGAGILEHFRGQEFNEGIVQRPDHAVSLCIDQQLKRTIT
jgi:hypothetical protein